MKFSTKPLTPFTLASKLGVTRELISRMTARGFQMPAGRDSVAQAVAFLKSSPYPISE